MSANIKVGRSGKLKKEVTQLHTMGINAVNQIRDKRLSELPNIKTKAQKSKFFSNLASDADNLADMLEREGM